MNEEQQWTITDENGNAAVTFTSFIDIDVRNEGQALAYPIEDGGFMNYNKVQSPLDITVTLAIQGVESDFDAILNTLDTYQAEPIKLYVSTPSRYYGPVTLESYSNRRTRENGAAQLTVELFFIEVREVQTQVSTTISKPRNPTSSSKISTGKTEPYVSALASLRS